MDKSLWFILASASGLVFFFVWLNASDNIKKECRWMFYTPIWMFSYSSYQNQGVKICLQAFINQLFVLFLAYLLAGGYIER